MKRNKKSRKSRKSSKKIYIILLIIILLFSIVLVNKTTKNEKINNIKQSAQGLTTNSLGDITNQIASTPNAPQLSAGMIPIKWNGDFWEVVNKNDTSNWYNYANGTMATMMLNDGKYTSEKDSTGKPVAEVGMQINLEDMGTIFTWIPKFAYNENNKIYYLKTTSRIAGDYITPELFTYSSSAANAEDIALRGVWVEQSTGLNSKISVSNLNTENNAYGLIANTKAETIVLDTNFINSINQETETGIKDVTSTKVILKVIDEKLTEPIMAELSAKGKTVTIKITKTDNGIKEILHESGIKTTDFDGTKGTIQVEKGGKNKFIIIDNIGNQREYQFEVVAPEIYVLTNQDNYVELNGVKWYPYGTQVRISYSENMSKLTGYYKAINGTTQKSVAWTNDGSRNYRDFSLTETMIYEAKIENSIGEILGEDTATIHIMPRETNIPSDYYYYNVGGIYPVKATYYDGSSNTYGTETYMYSTYIRDAARHMGLLKEGDTDKILYIKIMPSPQGGYIGGTRNGITSQWYRNNNNGYIFVTENGEEIKLPVVKNISNSNEENKITVSVEAQSYNLDKAISKYYYSIDNGDFIESDSNIYTFEDVQAYKNHTIQVYVEDSYGIVSQTTTTYMKTSNSLLLPTFEIVNEDTLKTVEYDGKIWYPYGTQVRINYAEDMTNLTGYYKYIYETINDESNWKTTSSATWEDTVYESTTYVAKLGDRSGEETKEVRFTIYIMPYEYGSIETNYSNNIGAIYPVRTAYSSSNTRIYGTKTYMYNSYIGDAARHMGLLKEGDTDKILYIKITLSPQGGYVVSERNGVTSNSYMYNKNGYVFVTENGEEYEFPIVDSVTLNGGENKITTTISATTNIGTIQKYYYSIDDGDFIESESNIYTFENVQAYQTHKIQVYAENSYGIISNTTEITGKTANNIPTPTFEIVDEETLETVEYDGKIWYPYNTQIKVTYAEDMTNLTAHYKYIFDERGTEAGWYSITNSTDTFYLDTSETVVVKLKDTLGNESEEVSIHLNIMAYRNLQSDYYNYGLGKIYPLQSITNSKGTVYGTDIYTYTTYVEYAAAHMGFDINEQLYIKIVESPVGGYKGTTKNGITSNDYNTNYRGYIFVKEDGTEIKTPTLNSITASGGENSITVNLDMDYKNGATQNKYYYKIDNNSYVEATNSIYTFEDVTPYQNHTITAYVKDSNGVISEEFTATAKPSNEVPTPIIEIVDKETLETVEYDGKTWYPNGTQIKITYAEDMTNLTPYYFWHNVADYSSINWTKDSNAERTTNASTSMKYYAKNVDSTGEEAVTEFTINVMPGEYLYWNHAEYCVGQIFPVIVTGSKSGSTYGIEKYEYNSYFGRAAMQMGILQEGETKKLFVKVVERPEDYYKSGTLNGITSDERFNNSNGYVFVEEDGTEIKIPTIEDLNLQVNGNSITATVVNAKAYNGASISKYYYRINNGEYIESNSNSYTFTDLHTGYYTIEVYVKDNKDTCGSTKTKSKVIETTGATLSGKSVKSYSQYAFTNDGTSIIPENGSNQGLHSTVAKGYVEIDLTGLNSVYKITVNAEVSSENNYDYGYATVSKTALIPDYTDSTGRFMYISGTVSAKDYSINIQGGQKYYLHFGYRKDGSKDTGNDLVRFNSLTIEQTTETNVSLVNSGESSSTSTTTVTGNIKISVPEDATYIEYKGEKWYPYNTKVTITYEGSGTRTHYRASRSELGNSVSSWTNISTSSSQTFSVTESTTYFARIKDSSGNIVAEESMKINILPNNTSIQSNYLVVGNIYPVVVSYDTSGNCYGTNMYSVSGNVSNINTATTHMGLINQEETNKLLYIKIINYPTGGYVGSKRNNVSSLGSNSGYAGFVFVDENEEEIYVENMGEVGANLSGYDVINNTGYTFKNDETGIIPTNGSNQGLHNTQANSYIVIDLTNYSSTDIIKISLNAEVSSEGADKGYATITQTVEAPSYSDSNGRFVYIGGEISATDYTTYISGGNKYYLHLGYRKDGSIDRGSDIVRFNSLSIEKVDATATITIESDTEPIEYNGELWYPYGTDVNISYPEGDFNKYYELQYFNGTQYSSGTVTDTNLKTISITKNAIIKAGINKEIIQTELKINIMPYEYEIQSKYLEEIGTIYPVKVTGEISSTIYGTAKYTYNSPISTSATHMGLVKNKETKLLYIKIIEGPEGGYKATRLNSILSKEYTTTSTKGYVFVDENGNEILEPIINPNATLSGYNVYPNGTYYFENAGDVLISNNKTNGTTASSYIELDLTGYNKDDMINIVLNMEISGYYNGYATISESVEPPAYNTSTNSIIYNVSNTTEAKNYETIVPGNKKYYLHLGSYRRNSSNNGNNVVIFNSIKVTKIENTQKPEIIIDESAIPIEYKGELWYPYGTKVTINYGEDNYRNVSIDNTKYRYYKINYDISNSVGSYSKLEKNYSTTLNESVTIFAKYSEFSEEAILKINIMPDDLYSSRYINSIGNIYPIRITRESTVVYGNNIYAYTYVSGRTTYYPKISSAAYHMGLIDNDETKVLFVKFVNSPAGGYIGAIKNNVTTETLTNWTENGYMFVTEDGQEILEPIINSVSTTGGTNSIIVTTSAEGQNNANVTKYYYKLDNNEVIETDKNVYVFDETDLYKTHTIKVYVRDSNGAISQTKEIITNAVQLNLLPTITLNTEPIECKGELWYPYGTEMTITYAEDMTNLVGYYSYIDDRNNSKNSWNTTSNSTYTTTLNYSVTYIAKTYNKNNSKETEEVSKTIRIMPSENNSVGATYYIGWLNNIYPVQVTGTTKGSVSGTDVYKYDSNISTAATHMGLVQDGETKILYIKIVSCPEGGYVGSTRNGITTSGHSNTYDGFVFVDENGNEITRPKIISANTSSGYNEISVTVDAVTNNGSIEKYYYSIDGGEYIETTNNTYTFTNIAYCGGITIRIYVKDSNGDLSGVKEIVGYRNTPEVTISLSQDPVEYNGELWYPYGTRNYN